jgi:hypothetical protein
LSFLVLYLSFLVWPILFGELDDTRTLGRLRRSIDLSPLIRQKEGSMGRAHTTEVNGKWGETKQRSENQVAFNSVLGPS